MKSAKGGGLFSAFPEKIPIIDGYCTMIRSATPFPRQPVMQSAGIPWTNGGQWSAVNETLAFFKDTQRDRLRQVFRLAAAVGSQIRALHGMARELALSSCRLCPTPCCDAAAPWYDFTDLLLIHFGGLPTPVGQPITRYGDICRHRGPAGCRLPRPQRPWICLWYTCPVQWAALSRTPASHREYHARIALIQTRRRQLEMAFIDSTAGKIHRPLQHRS